MQGSFVPDGELLDAAALCAHLVPEGSVHAFLAEHRRRLFPDDMFTDLFTSKRGCPSVPADVIATVMVLQALEGLSDRETVRQLETNIGWKAATGLALTDEAFYSTVLVLWRGKLRRSERPQRIFDAVRLVITESDVLAGKHRRALDSTVLDDAVARLDTITMLTAQIRRVGKLISELGEVRVREHNLEPGRPPCVDGGFTLDDFTIDTAAGTVTCPRTSPLPSLQQEPPDSQGTAELVRFGTSAPPPKPDGSSACTPNTTCWPPHRTQTETDEFDAVYRQQRPMIERTLAWLTRKHRRLRYRRIERNQLGWSHRCTAINLQRLLALGLTHNNQWTITKPA